MTLELPVFCRDTVFLMHENRVVEDVVNSVEVSMEPNGEFQSIQITVWVSLKNHGKRVFTQFWENQSPESKTIFLTKEELLESL